MLAQGDKGCLWSSQKWNSGLSLPLKKSEAFTPEEPLIYCRTKNRLEEAFQKEDVLRIEMEMLAVSANFIDSSFFNEVNRGHFQCTAPMDCEVNRKKEQAVSQKCGTSELCLIIEANIS